MDRPTQVASVFAAIGADLSGLNSGLRESREKLGGFQSFMGKAGQSITGIGTKMTLGITAPLVGLGAMMIKEAAGFEAGVNILDIAARQSGTGLQDLRAAALAVGADTQLVGIDAMEAAEAMTNFYKAGLSTTDVFVDLNRYLEEGTNLTGAMRAAIDLAAASDLNLAQTSDAVAIAMATYGLEASKATQIADSFVGAADASIAEVSGLVDALSTFGPTAAQFGWSLEDTNIALALLSERGIRGSEAGTALRSMMTNMMRDTDKVVGALQELNVSLYDQEGQMKGLPDIIGQVVGSFEGLTEEERNWYTQTLAGTYGMKAMQTLVAEGQEGWDQMAQGVASAASAQEVAEKRTEGFAGGLETLKGAVQTFVIGAGTDFLEKFATPAVVKLTGLVKVLNELPPESKVRLTEIGLALAAIGPAALGLGVAIRVLSAIPPQLLLIAVPAAILGGALFLASEGGEAFRASVRELGEALSKEEGLESLGKWVTKLSEFFDLVARSLGPEAWWQEPLGKVKRSLGPEAWWRGPLRAVTELIPPLAGTELGTEKPLLPWTWKLPTPDFGPAGREAASSFVEGGLGFLGIRPGLGETGLLVPVGVSPRREQIAAEGAEAARIFAEAYQRTLNTLLGGLEGTSVLAAARAKGTR